MRRLNSAIWASSFWLRAFSSSSSRSSVTFFLRMPFSALTEARRFSFLQLVPLPFEVFELVVELALLLFQILIQGPVEVVGELAAVGQDDLA